MYISDIFSRVVVISINNIFKLKFVNTQLIDALLQDISSECEFPNSLIITWLGLDQ